MEGNLERGAKIILITMIRSGRETVISPGRMQRTKNGATAKIAGPVSPKLK